MLPEDRGQQYRVRSDVRARLIRGLEAPLKLGLLPDTRLQLPRLPKGRSIFIIPGAAKRHKGLLRKSAPGRPLRAHITPIPPRGAGGTLLSGGRASVVPDPVRRHRHRRAVVLSHVLITGGVGRRTSRGRHSAPRAPRGSGATIPGTQRRPGQTHTRARGTIEARPPTRHTPPATKNYQKAAQFSSFRVPRSGIRDS